MACAGHSAHAILFFRDVDAEGRYRMNVRSYRRIAGGLIIGLAVLSCACAQDTDSTVEGHFAAAQSAQKAGELGAAAHEYQEILRLEPGLAEVHANLGLIYYAQSRFDESAKELRRAAQLKPGLHGVGFWLAVDEIKLGKPEAAVPLLRQAIERNPDAQVEKWLGTALWNSGEILSALDQLAKTSRIYPADTESRFVLADAYRKAGDREIETILAAAAGTPLFHQIYGDIYKDHRSWDRATAHYNEALKMDPHWKGAHLGIAEVDASQGKLAEAGAELRKELEIDPASAAARAKLAELELLADTPNDTPADLLNNALHLLGAAIRISPAGTLASLHLSSEAAGQPLTITAEDAAHLQESLHAVQSAPPGEARTLALAIVEHKLGLPEAARDVHAYKEAAAQPKVSGDGLAQASAMADEGRLADAEAMLRRLLAQRPNDLEARYALARVFKGQSLATMNALIQLAPDSPRVHQMLGQAYEDRIQERQALTEYRIVEQKDPSLPGIHYEVGHLLWKFGDHANALAELHQELKLNPENAGANGEIGSILLLDGEAAKAIPYLEAAQRSDPSLSLIHRQLGKAYMMQKDYPKAEAELKRAIKTDTDGSALYQLGMVYRAQGRTEEAAKAIAASQKVRAARLDESEDATRGGMAR
jgi:tetratricopeptide (TPR) repeat protein